MRRQSQAGAAPDAVMQAAPGLQTCQLAFPQLVPTETGSLPPVTVLTGPPSHPRPFSPELLESCLTVLLSRADLGCPGAPHGRWEL